MPRDEGLWQLADEAGMEPRYWDIAGNLHETTPETARTLLAALGVPARSYRGDCRKSRHSGGGKVAKPAAACRYRTRE